MNTPASLLDLHRENPARKFPPIALAGTIALILTAGPLAARTWHVPAEVPTIAAAIDSALAGDVIELATGVYPERNLVLGSGLTIRAADPANGATIDAEGAAPIFSASLQSNISLVGLTVTGGLYSNGAAARFQSCQALEIRDCSFVANRTTSGIGGAIQVSGDSSILIEDCLFQDNDAPLDDGGAIWLSCPVAEITRCTFVGNHAINGAGISCSGEDVRITACIFAQNSASNGAGLDLRSDAVVVADCLFVGNAATRGGAAGCWYGATPLFVGCTVVENAASDQGGGLYITGGSVATIERSLFAFNTDGGAVACANEGSASVVCSDVFGNAGGDWTGCLADLEGLDGNFSLDPVFCPWPDDTTRELAANSPCLPANSPCGQLVGAFGAGCNPIGVPETARAPLPQLLGNHPNPFNPQTTIAYEMPGADHVRIVVVDLRGRLVATLVDEVVTAGRHVVTWNGRDDAGRDVASGVYVSRLATGRGIEHGRMALVR